MRSVDDWHCGVDEVWVPLETRCAFGLSLKEDACEGPNRSSSLVGCSRRNWTWSLLVLAHAEAFIGVLEWAIVLVIVFYPVHRRLTSKIRYRGLSALLSCLLVILVVVLPLTFLTIAVAQELAKVVPSLPSQISQLLNT